MYNLNSLELELRRIQDENNARKAVRDRLKKELESLKLNLNSFQLKINDHEDAAVALQQLSASQQDTLKLKLERIITYALSTIFSKKYLFKVDFSQHGQQSQVLFLVEDELGNVQDIKSAHGGGLLVVAAFLLRIIVQLSHRPVMRKMVLLDEPFVQLSEEYRESLSLFLQDFVVQSDLQLIMVTHDQSLADLGDKKYRFKLENGLTKVEVL